MPFNMNFDSPVQLTDGTVEVKGSSEVLGEETTLLARFVTLQQGSNILPAAAADLALKWTTAALAADGLQSGDALALGTELHFIATPPTFVSGTWSQIVRIERT